MLSRVQRQYLDFAVRHECGEVRWTPRANGGGAIRRMVDRLVRAGLVAFDPKRMAWVVTEAGRRELRRDIMRRDSLLPDHDSLRGRPASDLGDRRHS